MAAGFELLFENLETIGFPIVLLLLFFLSVFYGIFKKYELISEDEAVVAVAAISLSFITTFGILLVVPATFFQQFFGIFSVVIALAILLLILMGLFGVDLSKAGEGHEDVQTVAVIIIGILALAVLAPLTQSIFGTQTLGPEATQAILTFVLIVVFGVVVWAIASE